MALKDKWSDRVNGQDFVNSNDVNTIAQELIETQEELAQNPPVGEKGDNGATFTPSVSADGVISWTNDKGLTNPTPRNIKGNTGTTGAKGDNGVTPHIGANGNWWIADADTGVKARGDDGANGEAGIGIASITQTTKSTADDGVNIITITLTNGTTQTFEVQNGSKGSQGIQGPAGADGATGPQGPAGPEGPAGEDGKSVIALTYDIDGRTTGSSGVSYLIKKEYYPDAKENDVGIYFGEDETYCEKGTIGIIEGVSIVQPTYLVFKPISNVVGAEGKSAYKYAQEGGYTGTEEEFGEKLAEVGNSQWQATFETDIALPIISEQTVTISQKGVTFTWDDGINLVVGNTYTVIWNGVKHICTCYIDMEGYPALGDDSLWSATSGTYPFYISRQSNITIWIFKETTGQETITFSILDGEDGIVYNTLPMEYLPAEVGDIKSTADSALDAAKNAQLTNELYKWLVTEIPADAFRNRKDITQISLDLPNLKVIGNYAFSSCINLTSIIIPDGVTSIGSNAFSSCINLTSIDIPNGVTSIGIHAFNTCGLTSITIPDSVTSLGTHTFANCSRLTNVTLGDGIKEFGVYIFANCSNLKTVTFKGTPASINSNAFVACSNVTFNVPWAEGALAGAPWGATNATINYNYTA